MGISFITSWIISEALLAEEEDRRNIFEIISWD
jgi:hypothetical protein